MTKNLETLLHPQVAEYLMEKVGENLNTLDASRNLSDWQACPSSDGRTVRIRATVEFDMTMTKFRGLVAEAARRELQEKPAA